MKKIITAGLILLSTKSYALFNVVTKATLENRLSLQSNINATLQNEMTGIKGDVSGVKSSIGELNLKIGQINNSLSARMAAIDNSKNDSTSIGGNQSNTNDSKMITELAEKNAKLSSEINNIFKTIIITFLIQMIALFKWQGNMSNKLIVEKDKQLERVLESKDKKEAKIDDWQNAMIDRLVIKEVRDDGKLDKEAKKC